MLLVTFFFGVCFGLSLPPSFAGQAAQLLALSANSTSGFDRLAFWVDSVGSRLSGSVGLENGINLAEQMGRKEGFVRVRREAATIPRWERGEESLFMVSPYHRRLGLAGLGTSVGGNVTASLVVVRSFSELSSSVSGKIVLFNFECDWEADADACYGNMAVYRTQGASHGAKFGAVATLVRSLTGRSLYTPHTGIQHYQSDVVPVPTACITTEDADFFQRMHDRNVSIVLSLFMGAKNFDAVQSSNLVFELPGSDFPEQIVMLGGHVDSWDLSEGATDDGAGFMVTWEAVSLIMRAGIRPRRTIRLVGWVCEEFGGVGAQQYFDAHKQEAGNVSMVLESDLGVFQPYGIQLTSTNPATINILSQIMAFASPINASRVVPGGGDVDSGPWIRAGVPGLSPFNDARRYFDVHHTSADTVSHIDKQWFEPSAASIAIAILGVAQLDELLPR